MSNFRDIEYETVSQPGPGAAHIRFTGTFDGDDVTWDAHIYTRDRYNREHPDTPVTHRLIEVGALDGQTRPLTVCLDVTQIDTTVLVKTIIMIRNYRRLQAGRHAFGSR